VAVEDESECSAGLPPTDFCLPSDATGAPFTGVFLVPQLPWLEI